MRLTLFSYGGGQDSFTILLLLIHDPVFRAKYAPGDLQVVMSDTGAEHTHTYEHLKRVRALCYEHAIAFTLIGRDSPFRGKNWGTIWEQYNTHSTIGSISFPQSCTDKLKIKPIDNWLEHHIDERYGCVGTRKRGFYDFHEKYGKINLILGFAAGEERRKSSGSQDPKWKQRTMVRQYPLIDLGLDRKGCHQMIRMYGEKVPYPSNCTICFYMSLQELLWMEHFETKVLRTWAAMEQRKFDRDIREHGERRNGVFGSRSIMEQLQLARERYGHLTPEELDEHKMSHGHCTKSRY